MLVPVVLALSVSNVPSGAAIVTVSQARFALSVSRTVEVGATSTGAPFSVKVGVPVTVTTGESLTTTTVMPTASLSDLGPPVPVGNRSMVGLVMLAVQ